MQMLTGGAVTACSIYKHSLACPVHVLLWGQQLFYQMHPALRGSRMGRHLQEPWRGCGQASLGLKGTAVQFHEETSLIRMVLFLF